MFTALAKETNKIEGIIGATLKEVKELERFVGLEHISVGELTKFLSVFEPTAVMRVQSGMNVRVGTHLPPSGGVGIMYRLDNILANINEGTFTAFENHCDYETLHPFTDGNGRSGRALWTWQMKNEGYFGRLEMGFLHNFYYQALEASQYNRRFK
jgi:hypothetical protein